MTRSGSTARNAGDQVHHRRSSSVWLTKAVLSLLVLLTGLLLAQPAWSQAGSSPNPSASTQCETAIATSERIEALPSGLLNAIAHIESGRHDPASGAVRPWPWTINADGISQMFLTKNEAVDAVRGLQAQGVRSIDVGCLQVNLLHHPKAFATLDHAFDPVTNVAYAARFLHELFAETKDWTEAAVAYHSHTPERGVAYRHLVLTAWKTDEIQISPSRSTSKATATMPPLLRPFAPPPLPSITDPPPRPDAVARLLAQTPDCVATTPPAPWFENARSPSCGRSPFATTSLLRRILAAE